MDDCVGSELAKTSYNWRRYIDLGVHMSGGSDCPVEDCDPLANMYYAVTRMGMDGKPWYPENAVTMEEALKMFTIEGAYAGYDIAHTVTQDDGKVVVEPESFTFDNDFKAVYHSMRYSRFCYDEENWAHYNDSGVPTFTGHTMTMTRLQGTRASSAVRTRTKEMFRRTQPQAHTARRMRN